jgi:hypothetical protein
LPRWQPRPVNPLAIPVGTRAALPLSRCRLRWWLLLGSPKARRAVKAQTKQIEALSLAPTEDDRCSATLNGEPHAVPPFLRPPGARAARLEEVWSPRARAPRARSSCSGFLVASGRLPRASVSRTSSVAPFHVAWALLRRRLSGGEEGERERERGVMLP